MNTKIYAEDVLIFLDYPFFLNIKYNKQFDTCLLSSKWKYVSWLNMCTLAEYCRQHGAHTEVLCVDLANILVKKNNTEYLSSVQNTSREKQLYMIVLDLEFITWHRS